MPQCTHVDQRIKLGIFPHLALDRVQDSNALFAPRRAKLAVKGTALDFSATTSHVSLASLGLYMHTACLAFMVAL